MKHEVVKVSLMTEIKIASSHQQERNNESYDERIFDRFGESRCHINALPLNY